MTNEVEYWGSRQEDNEHSTPWEMVPPDKLSEESKIGKGGQYSDFAKNHLAKCDTNTNTPHTGLIPKDDEPSAKDKAHESNGIGMTHDSQGSKTTEYIAPDPNLMPNANEPSSAGLRNQWSCHQDWT